MGGEHACAPPMRAVMRQPPPMRGGAVPVPFKVGERPDGVEGQQWVCGRCGTAWRVHHRPDCPDAPGTVGAMGSAAATALEWRRDGWWEQLRVRVSRAVARWLWRLDGRGSASRRAGATGASRATAVRKPRPEPTPPVEASDDVVVPLDVVYCLWCAVEVPAGYRYCGKGHRDTDRRSRRRAREAGAGPCPWPRVAAFDTRGAAIRALNDKKGTQRCVCGLWHVTRTRVYTPFDEPAPAVVRQWIERPVMGDMHLTCRWCGVPLYRRVSLEAGYCTPGHRAHGETRTRRGPLHVMRCPHPRKPAFEHRGWAIHAARVHGNLCYRCDCGFHHMTTKDYPTSIRPEPLTVEVIRAANRPGAYPVPPVPA
jgi:hypothetical protein